MVVVVSAAVVVGFNRGVVAGGEQRVEMCLACEAWRGAFENFAKGRRFGGCEERERVLKRCTRAG